MSYPDMNHAQDLISNITWLFIPLYGSNIIQVTDHVFDAFTLNRYCHFCTKLKLSTLTYGYPGLVLWSNICLNSVCSFIRVVTRQIETEFLVCSFLVSLTSFGIKVFFFLMKISWHKKSHVYVIYGIGLARSRADLKL